MAHPSLLRVVHNNIIMFNSSVMGGIFQKSTPFKSYFLGMLSTIHNKKIFSKIPKNSHFNNIKNQTHIKHIKNTYKKISFINLLF